MASDERSKRREDDEIKIVEEADRQGKVNIVKGIINDNEVQQIIKSALLKETIKNSVIMACLMVGLLKLYDVAKIVIGFNWVGDFIISIILILAGLIYMLRNMLSGKKNGDGKASSSDSRSCRNSFSLKFCSLQSL